MCVYGGFRRYRFIVARPENPSVSYSVVRLMPVRVAASEESALQGGSRLIASKRLPPTMLSCNPKSWECVIEPLDAEKIMAYPLVFAAEHIEHGDHARIVRIEPARRFP